MEETSKHVECYYIEISTIGMRANIQRCQIILVPEIPKTFPVSRATERGVEKEGGLSAVFRMSTQY